MADDSGVSLGEVYRLQISQSRDLAEIKSDVKTLATSKSDHQAALAEHEVRLDGHDREIRDLKRDWAKLIAALLIALAGILAAWFRGGA